MDTTHFFIKNMVCDRCVRTVADGLTRLGLTPVRVALGQATVAGQAAPDEVAAMLHQHGFALLDQPHAQIVERTKAAIIARVRQPRGPVRLNESVYLAQAVGKDYAQLSALFSAETGTTIEQYTIRQRIERAKELLTYGELTLSEIAFQLHYSSVQHLSNQFHKVTGLTPTAFKRQSADRRQSLDAV